MHEYMKSLALYMDFYFHVKKVLSEILTDPYLPKRTRRKLAALLNLEVCTVERKIIDRKYPYSKSGQARDGYAGSDNKRTKDPSPKQITLLKEQS